MNAIGKIRNFCVKIAQQKRTRPVNHSSLDLAQKAPDGLPVAREHVVWAYRLFLDSEPESEAAVLAN